MMDEEIMEYHSQIKAPRLCFMQREDIGYGFNLHGEKGVVGQYISAVDPGGAADKSGLCVGDRVIEVNSENVENSKHNEVVEHIRADPDKTSLLVIDQVTDKYLASIGKPVTADLAKVKSVTEIYPIAASSSKRLVNETEISEKIEDLNCNECEVNIERDDTQNSVDKRDESSHVEENLLHNNSIEKEHSEPTEQVVENSTFSDVVDGKTSIKPSEKPVDSEYYADDSTVNILAGVECEEKPLKTVTPSKSGTGSPYEKIRPNNVPRRKEVKQGDWRAKLALFDQL